MKGSCRRRLCCRRSAQLKLSTYGRLAYLYCIRCPYVDATSHSFELISDLGTRIRVRRVMLGLTQAAAAERSGVSYRTWRRMERHGQASIEDLAKATIALRCQSGSADLFPQPAAATMDELLRRQKEAATAKRRLCAPHRPKV